MTGEVSSANRVQASGGFPLPVSRDHAFDLFTAVGECRWVPGWNPRFFGSAEPQEVGLVFETGEAEQATIWVVLESDRERGRLKYARVTPGSRAGTVEVHLSTSGSKTLVEVTYDLTALAARTNDLDQYAPALFSAMMEEWRSLTTAYLASAPRLNATGAG